MFKTVPATLLRSSGRSHEMWRPYHHERHLKRAIGYLKPPCATSLAVKVGGFFAFCELCGERARALACVALGGGQEVACQPNASLDAPAGTGDGIVPCTACEGAGKVVTKVGGLDWELA